MMQIGDKVCWTKTSRSKRTISMTLKEGVIESMSDDVATIRLRSGRLASVHCSRLSMRGQPTDIDLVLQVIREASV